MNNVQDQARELISKEQATVNQAIEDCKAYKDCEGGKTIINQYIQYAVKVVMDGYKADDRNEVKKAVKAAIQGDIR